MVMVMVMVCTAVYEPKPSFTVIALSWAFYLDCFDDYSACRSLGKFGDLGVGSCFCCKGEITLNRNLAGSG